MTEFYYDLLTNDHDLSIYNQYLKQLQINMFELTKSDGY